MAILELRSHSQPVLRLERRTYRRLHTLLGDYIQAVALQEHGQHRLQFHHGKGGAQTGAGACTKGKVGTGRMLLPMLRIEALGPEDA